MHRHLGRWLSRKSDKAGRIEATDNPAGSAADQAENDNLGSASKLRPSSAFSTYREGGESSKLFRQPSEESPYGLKELVSQPPENASAVDIIAIHGLNGHREKTWIDKTTRVNWLSDPTCLPKDIPNARVLSFGYKSTTYFSRADSDVRDFASELLSAVRASRKSQAEKGRPIIFVCHSLGGIVFKQAVVRAHEQDRFYASLLDNIQGVAFFGTPHRGSDLASWGSIAARIAQAAALGFSTNPKLLKDLKVRSDMLKSISDSFAYRGGHFKVRSFYETEFMPNLNCRVVDKDSATLGWSNELDIASTSNHSNICKFPSAADQRYQSAVFAILEMVEMENETVNPPFTASQEKCMEQLNAESEYHLGQIDDPVPGTCEWVLSHERFQQWESCPGSSLLWITSNAGCGKSVMAKFLVNHFQLKREGTCGNFGCFFFMDGVGNQNNASAAISALLHQLYQSQHGLIAHAMKKFEGTPGHIFTRFSTLWPILVNSIDDAKTRDIVWVLDGLDECESKSLRQFITSFKIFFDSHCSAENRLSKCSFKVILLSRPHSLIQQTLGLFTDRDLIHPNNNKFRLSGEDESQAITTDIIRFAQWKINDLASASALPTEVLERLQGKLVVGADFTFLWISLIIKMVDDSTVNGISVAGVEAILNTTSLNDVYQHLLRGTSREFPGKTRKLLSIILASARPLTVDEMCVAVEVEEEGQGSSTQSLAMLGQLLHRPFDNHIRQLCGHFVRIRRRKLYFVHQTAREFLMNESFQLEATPLTETLASCVLPNMADAIWQPIKLEQANKTLLRICVSYIKMFNTREKGRTDSLWDHGQIAQYLDMCRGDPLRAFFPYAAIHWIQHYRPLRKDLFNEFDYLLQPGTGIFDVWIRVHSTWSYETGVSNEGKGAILTNSEVDVPEEPSAILILLEDQHLPYVGNGELQDLRWRFDRLQDWLRYAWYFRRPASTMIMQKFSKLKQGLEDQISQTAGGQSGGSEANWPWNDLTSLRHLTGELEEERRKDFRANSDFVLEKSMALRQDLRHQISRSTKRVLGMSGEGGLKAEWMGNIDRQNRHLLLLDTLTGQLEEEQDRRIGMVSQEDKAKSLERQKHIIARLHSQTEELEQKRLKAFAANPDLKRVRTENRVENLLNWEILAERQRQDILKQPKKEEDLHEVLVHFGLFDLDEEGLEDDEFLSEYWQPRIDALNEHRDVDEEEEDDFGDEKVEANIPDRVKHYIREKRRMRIRGSLGAGTPGAELPGLSNPEAWTFKDLRVSHHRASSE